MDDAPVTKRLICPILSAPAQPNKKGGHTPPYVVDCLGVDCQLFRAEEQNCSLLSVPDVIEGVRSVRTDSESAISQASAIFERSEEGIVRSLNQWRQAKRDMEQLFESVREEVRKSTSSMEEEGQRLATSLKDAILRQDALLGALDGEVVRLREEARVETANNAAEAAERLYRAGNLQGALADLLAAKETAGATPELENTLGCIYLRLYDIDQARAAFTRCLAIDTNFASGRVNHGLALLLAGEYEAAEDELRTGIRMDGTSGAGWNSLGNLLFAVSRRHEAVEAWFKAVEVDPGCAPAWENLRRQQLLDHFPYDPMVEAARSLPAD